MGNIIGNNPKKWASNQVKIREQQLGLENKTPEALAWSTNNTAWIRAISAVSISGSAKSEELTGVPYYEDGALSKEFMLFSGTSALYENTDEDGNFTEYEAVQKSGVLNTSWDRLNKINDSAYGFVSSAERGLVPMPGIESLNINTYNRGSLRRASLKIKAYSREQFAILDALFMRPGYSLLIEWGHTMYFKGTPESPTFQTANFNTKAFRELNRFLDGNGDVEYGSSTILKSISADRGNGSNLEFDDNSTDDGTQGNYDGFYGKITNFVWGLDSDGSYNIEVKAISIGDVIESLTINNVAEPDTIASKPKTNTPNPKNITSHTFNLKDDLGEYSVTVTDEPKKYREYWEEQGFEKQSDGFWYKNPTKEFSQYKQNYPSTIDRFTLFRPSNTLEPEPPLENDVLITSKNKTIFNKWLYSNYNWLTNNIGSGKDISTNSESGSEIRTLNTYGAKTSNYRNLIMVQPKTSRTIIQGGTSNTIGTTPKLAQNSPYQYIKLEEILLFIQNNLLMQSASEENDKSSPYIEFDLDSNNYMYTQPGQLSSDPNVCIIPFIFPKPLITPPTPKEASEGNTFPNTITDNSVITYWKDVLEGINFNIESPKKSDYVANLLSIPVNIHYVAQTLQGTTSNNAVKLLPFLENLMQGIQVALGSLNKFSVTYDHDSNKIIIRDDVPLDPNVVTETKKTPDNRTFFNVTGYKKIDTGTNKPSSPFITNVGISTTLSNAFATMISIGAQDSSQSDISNSTSLTKFNKGLRDSVTPSKISKAVASKTKESSKDPAVVFAKTIASLNENESLLTYFYKNGRVPSGELITSSQSQISAFNRYVSTINLYQRGGNQIPSSQGFIPFSMNLDMMGFSGLRIYEKFYISAEILPKSYEKTMSFLVKGLSHSVDSKGWITKIDSLTVTNVDNLPQSPDIPPPNYSVEQVEGEIFNDATSDELTDLRLNGTGAGARALVETFLKRPITDEEWDNLVAATAAEASKDPKERALVMKVIATRARFRNTSIITVLTAPNQFQAVTGKRGSKGPGKNFKMASQRTADQIFVAVEEFFPSGKSFYCFTANNPKAYKPPGTNPARIAQEKRSKGWQVVGKTLFSRPKPKFDN